MKKFWSKNIQEIDYLGDLGVEGGCIGWPLVAAHLQFAICSLN